MTVDHDARQFRQFCTGVLVGEGVTDVATSNSLGSITLAAVGNNDAQSKFLGGTALSGSAFFSSTDVSVNKDINILSLDGPVPASCRFLDGSYRDVHLRDCS